MSRFPQPTPPTDQAGPAAPALPQAPPATNTGAAVLSPADIPGAPIPAPAPAPDDITFVTPPCLVAIAAAEKRYAIPSGLLMAIGLAESGRRDPASGASAPWPWSVNSMASGQFFADELSAEHSASVQVEGAAAHVGVGCMQIDLERHPTAFTTIEQAFSPAANVDYAARLLHDLAARQHSWVQAAASYQSGDPDNGPKYLGRVLYYWKQLGVAPPADFASLPSGPESPLPTDLAAASGLVKPFRGYVIPMEPDPVAVAADFYGSRDYEPALVLYHAILESRADDRTALMGMAQTLRGGRAFDQAEPYLERLLAVAPNDKAVQGLLFANIQDLPRPLWLPSLTRAMNVDPSAAAIPARIAQIHEQDGDLAAATAAMGRAVALAPRNAGYLLDYASLLDRHGDRAAAISAYGAFLNAYDPDGTPLSATPADVQKRLSYLRSDASK